MSGTARSPENTELLSRRINDLVTDMARLKSMIQEVRMCNLQYRTSQQISHYSLGISCPSHLLSNKLKDAVSIAVSGR